MTDQKHIDAYRAWEARMQPLTDEFAAWAARQDSLPEGDAMEMLMTDLITPAQREWLSDFVQRWEAAEEEGE